MTNRLVIKMKNFGHIVTFVRVKQLLEPMQSLITCLQRNFGFKKMDEIILVCKDSGTGVFL